MAKQRKNKLNRLKDRMDERGETPATLSKKTTTVSPGRIIALCQPVDNEEYKALDHEALELANALACFPENLINKPKDPVKVHAGGQYGRPKGMSIAEDNWSTF